MPRQFKIGDIPTSRLLPNGYYVFRIAGLEEAYAQSSGILMYKLELRVVAPEFCVNRGHYDNLFIGKTPRPVPEGASEEWARYCELEDLEGADPLTQRYSSGLRILKQILIAADHDLAGADVIDMDEVFEDFTIKDPREQIQIGAKLMTRKDPRDGRERNEITVFYAPDAEEPRLDNVSPNGAASGEGGGPRGGKNRGKPATAASAVRKKRTRAHAEAATGEEDDED